MSRKLGLFKRIRLYRHYKRLLRNNKEIISQAKFNLRIDYVGRLYTVINLNTDVKIYGAKLAEKYISEYVNEVDKMFQNIGISEYIGILDIQEETEMDYVIIFGFKYIDTAKVANRLLLTILSIPIIWVLISLFF